MSSIKKATEVATIDVSLITFTPNGSSTEYIFDTASNLQILPDTETIESVKLSVKGSLKSQKGTNTILTGNTITLTDNVFSPEVVEILQGGTIYYYANEDRTEIGTTATDYGIAGYDPPKSDSHEKGKTFTLNAYSAQYDAAGLIVAYEKISYPNCKGQPIALSSEDNVFRAPEYTITSSPKKGEPPYTIRYVDGVYKTVKLELPIVSNWVDIAYGNGMYVAVSEEGKAIYSYDAIVWYIAEIPNKRWTSVVFGNGKFIVVGYNVDTVVYSENGINWDELTLPLSRGFFSIIYEQGKFVAVAFNNDTSPNVIYSDDGINWKYSTIPYGKYWNSVTYGNGRFVASGYNSQYIAYSENAGETWDSIRVLSGGTYFYGDKVAFGDNTFVAISRTGGDTMVSTDNGESWGKYGNRSVGYTTTTLAFGKNTFVILTKKATGSGRSMVEYSTDKGKTFKNKDIFPDDPATWSALLFDGEKFIGLSSDKKYFIHSYDGINWFDTAEMLVPIDKVLGMGG